MSTTQSSRSTTDVIQCLYPQPSQQNINTTVGEPQGSNQYTIQPSQRPIGVIFPDGQPYVHAAPIGLQGTLQTVNTTPMMMQRDYPQTIGSLTNERVFHVWTLKVFGAVQLVLGGFLCIVCVVGVILNRLDMAEQHRPDFFASDLTCLVLSGWIILTGFLPMCMSWKSQSSLRCLKISFMVCCIIGAAGFLPPVFTLGVYGIDIRTDTTTISVLIALTSLLEVGVAIVSATCCYCCTKWKTDADDQQRYLNLLGSGSTTDHGY